MVDLVTHKVFALYYLFFFFLVFHLYYGLLLFISVYKFKTLNELEITLSAQLVLK